MDSMLLYACAGGFHCVPVYSFVLSWDITATRSVGAAVSNRAR